MQSTVRESAPPCPVDRSGCPSLERDHGPVAPRSRLVAKRARPPGAPVECPQERVRPRASRRPGRRARGCTLAADRFRLPALLYRTDRSAGPPAGSAPRPPRPATDAAIRDSFRARAGSARVEAAGLAFIWLLALAIRLPYLWWAPATPDELRETAHALAAYQYGDWLTPDPAAPFVGPLYDVLLGVAFGLFGPSPSVARLVTAVLAAATVPLVYVLARELARPVGRRRLEDGFVGPRLAGLVAAGLVAASAAHVVIASHTAVAQNLAPLFGVAGLFGLERALGTRDGRWLVPGGILLGLALQTHPSVAALLPGALLALWRAGRRIVLSGWGAAGLAALLLAYANVLVPLLQDGSPLLAEGASTPPTAEARGARSPAAEYGTTLVLELLRLGRLLASQLANRPPSEDLPLDPAAWSYAGLAVVGLAILALRGRPLLPFAALGFLLILPLFATPDPTSGARTLMPVVVIGLTAIGVAVGTFAPLVARRGSLARLAVVAALLLLVLAPLAELTAYYARAPTPAPTEGEGFPGPV